VSRCIPSRLLLPLLAIVAAGCASHQEPAPFNIKSALTTSSHFLGTPISGPITGDASKINYNDALEVRVEWFALEQKEPSNLPLLASEATLVTAKLAGQAVLPSTSLTSDARLGWFNDAPNPGELVHQYNPSRINTLGQSQAALPMGVSAVFRLVETGGLADLTFARPEPRYVELALDRASANQLRFALAVQDEQGSQTTPVFQREVAVFQHKRTNPQTALVLVVPFVLAGLPNHAVAAVLTVSDPAGDAAFQKAVAKCKTDLESPRSAEASPLWTLGLQRAMNELDNPAHRRAALVYLAMQGDSAICEDVAMLADDNLLNQIASSIKRDAPATIQAGNLDAYSWILDRSAITAMQPLLTKATLAPELISVLTQHFGEPGRHSAAVDEVMRGAGNRHDLDLRLASENYIYLEDSSPASRVRAYQWLSARKLAPKGYDPLASPKQRRQALDAALSGGAT
jgi:hypothetical protein